MVQEAARRGQEGRLDKFIKRLSRTSTGHTMSLQRKVEDLEKEILALVDRMETLEESLEEIHERLDEIEEKLEEH